MQAVALHFGRLTQVQPILTTELLFLVFLLGSAFGFRIGWREWLGTAATAGGLAGFLDLRRPRRGQHRARIDRSGWRWGSRAPPPPTVAVLLALRGSRWRRAAMFGAASAIGFAFTASLTKVVSELRRPRLGLDLPPLGDLRAGRLRVALPVPRPERLPRRARSRRRSRPS